MKTKRGPALAGKEPYNRSTSAPGNYDSAVDVFRNADVNIGRRHNTPWTSGRRNNTKLEGKPINVFAIGVKLVC